MKKFLFILLCLASSQLTFARAQHKHFVSFSVSDFSTKPVVFEIDGFFNIGPLNPGEKIVLSEDQYNQLKGHYLQLNARTDDESSYFPCPSTVIERIVEYSADFKDGLRGCGYTKYGLNHGKREIVKLTDTN